MAGLVIYPFAGLAVALGRIVLTSYNFFAGLALALRNEAYGTAKSHLTKV